MWGHCLAACIWIARCRLCQKFLLTPPLISHQTTDLIFKLTFQNCELCTSSFGDWLLTLPLLSDSLIAFCRSLNHCLAVCSSRARNLNSRSLPSMWMLPAMIRKSLLERIWVHLGDGGFDYLEVQDALGLRICLGFIVGELSILQNKEALLNLSNWYHYCTCQPTRNRGLFLYRNPDFS